MKRKLLISLVAVLALAGGLVLKAQWAMVLAGRPPSAAPWPPTANLIFEWHAENVDVTLGTPSGGSVGDQTATANSGVNLSTTQVYDGTYAIQVPTANDSYQFDWSSSPAIVNPNAGTLDFRVYFTTDGDQTIFDQRVDASNRITISVDSGNNYLLLTHVAGGTSSTARTIVNAFTTGAWYHVKARWDTTAHNTLYLRISCDLTNGESGSNDNGTTALGTWSGTSGLTKFGDVNNAAGVYYLDAIYIYNEWVVEMEQYYVDPSYGGGGNNGTSAAPYVSANAAAAAKLNNIRVNPTQIICRTSSSTPDTTRVDLGALGQFIPTSTAYVEFIADTGHAAGASWDATKYHLYPAYGVQSGTAFNSSKNYVRITNLQIGISTQTSTAEIVYWSGLDLRMSGCLVRGTNSTTQATRGMSISTTASTVKIWNSIFYAMGVNSSGASAAIQNHGTTSVYSCTLIGQGTNTINNASDGFLTIKNCYAGGGITLCYSDESAGNMTLTTSAASDTTGTSGLDSIAINTTTFVNVTAGTENWDLGGSSALNPGAGTDTSGEGAPLNFTTDILGTARGSSWSVGAVQ